jgi:hypothetical protein
LATIYECFKNSLAKKRNSNGEKKECLSVYCYQTAFITFSG